MVTYTVQRASDVGGVYVYLWDDEKMAAMTESSMAKSGPSGMVVRRRGTTMVMAYAGSGKTTAQSLLDEVFPP